MDDSELIERAERWRDGDLDPQTARWIDERIASRDFKALRRAFAQALSFGTAGLRGPVGAGPAAMNLSTVALASFGLGSLVTELFPQRSERIIVVGFDARPDSRRFAECAAHVLSGRGVSVLLATEPVPTPVVGFAVRHLGACAGVVVTASHNPRGDNGYKVYDDQGVQIVSPWDTRIRELSNGAPDPVDMPSNPERISTLPQRVTEEYLNQVHTSAAQFRSSKLRARSGGARRVAYTPLHGVGWSYVQRVARRQAPQIEMVPVESQKAPDGTFPTLAFPNPEEPDALVELLETARDQGIDVAMANDPDADRFCLCLPSGGRLLRLSGDTLGLLFADACLRRPQGPKGLVTTIVSSPSLEELARKRGGHVTRSLTGFKWLCRAALDMQDFAFAYEEAIGYCFAAPPGLTTVYDKDGLLALAVALELLVEEGGGRRLFERLQQLFIELGLWGSFGKSIRLDGPNSQEVLDRAMAAVRREPPTRLGDFRLSSPVDYSRGAETRPSYLGEQNLLSFELSRVASTNSDLATSGTAAPDEPFVDSGRLLLRPSGTEPKLKAYIHLRSEFDANSDYDAGLTCQGSAATGLFSELCGYIEERVPGAGFGSRLPQSGQS